GVLRRLLAKRDSRGLGHTSWHGQDTHLTRLATPGRTTSEEPGAIMSTHIFDELPLLLTGEADRATVALAADHLRECEDCQQELVSALVAHASLSSAARFAPELRSLLSTAAEDRPAEPAQLPDLTPIFEMAKQEARAPRHSVAPPRARPHRGRRV